MSEKQSKNQRTSLVVISSMIVLAALSRLIPHPPNVTPISAMALFGAAYIAKSNLKFLIPILAFFISDLLLNNLIYRQFYPDATGIIFITQNSWFVYGAMILIVILGMRVLKSVKVTNLLLASISASLLFYLVTNFGSWFSIGMYPKTAAGLAACFTAGLPFLINTILGDLLFTGLLFGSVYAMSQRNVFKWA